jgi:hypothetical protein
VTIVATRRNARRLEAQRCRLHLLIFSEKASPAGAPADDDCPASRPSRGVLSSERASGALLLLVSAGGVGACWLSAMMAERARQI